MSARYTGRLVVIVFALQAKRKGQGAYAFFQSSVVGVSPRPSVEDIADPDVIETARLYERDPSIVTCVDPGFPGQALRSDAVGEDFRRTNGLPPEQLLVLRRKGGKWHAFQ